MVDGVLIDIDAAPNAGVVGAYRDDPEARFYAVEVSIPKVVCWRLANDHCLASLLTILPLRLDSVRAISDIQSAEYLFEST